MFLTASLLKLKQTDGIIGYSLTVEDQALLQYNNNLQPVLLKGVDDNYKNINGVSKIFLRGDYQLGSLIIRRHSWIRH